MSMAIVPPHEPKPAALKVVMDIQCWTHPNLKRHTVQLLDGNGRILCHVEGVWQINVGTSENL